MRLTLPSILLACTSFTTLAGDGHWEYTGKHGTAHWGEEFALCGNGVNQSPIDISASKTIEADLPSLVINYQESNAISINNGHTIQANIKGNSTFTNDAGTFNLLQFHFHAPSENTINGKHFPLEVHFVHADQDSRLAVIGVMFEEGKKNTELEKIWSDMPESKQSKEQLINALSAAKLLPKEKSYYRFNGSLTTPPCTEGVRWFVLKDTIEASKAQIDKFSKVMGTNTNRPTQPINARIVLQ
ncbi:MAG: carbonic anhydrase [Colwellia sp.]|nr:MAG: carbonic anhydrase [Colwellia sp.]WNA12318.1 carbonic anhydrase [Colwellia demingiae]